MGIEKIKTHKELSEILLYEKEKGKIIGFTNGCFDILHSGHISYLAKAKDECDILVLGVNSDDSVKRLKGEERPVNSQDARLLVLSSVEYIDYLTIFTEDTPRKLIEICVPDILFKGGDWTEEDVVGGDFVKKNGGKVSIIPYVDGFSTTKIISKIKEENN